MLALVSISTAIRRRSSSPRFKPAAWRRNGRANANASRHRAAARRRSRSRWSSRLRRVSRGGDGDEEHQRAERHLAPGRPADQVEHDRRRDGRAAQDVEGREEAHRAPPRPGAAPAARAPAAPHPRLQEVEQHQLQRPVGGDRLVLDPQVDARPLDLGGVGGEPAEVLGARRGRVDVELPARFHVVEHRRRRERELRPRPGRGPAGRRRRARATAGSPAGSASESAGASRSEIRMISPRLRTVAAICFERLGQVGRAAGGLALEHRHQAAEMARAVPRRQVLGDPVLEREQPDRVALLVRK